MKIEKIVRAYYREKLDTLKVPAEVPPALLRKAGQAEHMTRTDLRAPRLIFFLAAAAILVFLILETPDVSRSLQRLDPDNTKIQTVDREIKKGLDNFWAWFYPRNPQQRRLP